MFSVVIPLYNKELSIRNTIQSVLDQSYRNFEIIIVNDGSTDNSIQVVQSFDDNRIRIINKSNGGVSSARNLGIEQAKFDWIAFLDGDDIWQLNHLEVIEDLIGIFYNKKVFATSFISSSGKGVKGPEFTETIIVTDYFAEAMRYNLIWTGIVIVHKSCFEKVGKFNIKIARGEDLDMWARLGKNYEIIKSPVITALYKLDTENRSYGQRNPISKSIISRILLKETFGSERLYYKRMIRNKIIESVKYMRFKTALFLVFRYNFQLLK